MSEDVRQMLVDLVKAHRHQTDADMKSADYSGHARTYLRAPMKERVRLCNQALADLGAVGA